MFLFQRLLAQNFNFTSRDIAAALLTVRLLLRQGISKDVMVKKAVLVGFIVGPKSVKVASH